jgi:hypothetical protein
VTTRLCGVNVRRSLAAVVVALMVPVLSSCGVNFSAQTDQVYQPAVGSDDRSSMVDVLNAMVVSGSTGSGTVVATLVNNDQAQDDTLRGVAGAGKDASIKVTPGGDTTIPTAGLLNLATSGSIFATGEQLEPGSFVELTFTFDRAEPVTLDVPVVSADNPAYADIKLPPAS